MDLEKAKVQSQILIESLPYLRKFHGKTVVIKYGGGAMVDAALKTSFARSISLLKYAGVHPVVVHGGGPQVGSMLKNLNMESKFHNGLRITDDSAIDIVEMVLRSINKSIVGKINLAGGKAVGFSGKDGATIRARKKDAAAMGCEPSQHVDLGHVGHIVSVDVSLLNTLIFNGFIPVVAPVGFDDKQTYNINADEVAGALASALKAVRFLLLTDVEGIVDKNGQLISSISINELKALIDDGVISGGMIPKARCCVEALKGGAEKVAIINGRLENAVLLELFTEQGVGTEIIDPGAF